MGKIRTIFAVVVTLILVGQLFGTNSYTLPLTETFRFPLDDVDWVNSISRKFGIWASGRGYHLAEDVPVSGGTPVKAAAQGRVRFAGTGIGAYGGVVIIEHFTGIESVTTLYGHLSAREGLEVTFGQEVSRGQIIGYIAYSNEQGGQNGEHLHFGIRKGPYVSGNLYYFYDAKQEQWRWTWAYLGYSKDANLSETEKTDYDITHEEMLRQWYRPSSFISSQISTLQDLDRNSNNLIDTEEFLETLDLWWKGRISTELF